MIRINLPLNSDESCGTFIVHTGEIDWLFPAVRDGHSAADDIGRPEPDSHPPASNGIRPLPSLEFFSEKLYRTGSETALSGILVSYLVNAHGFDDDLSCLLIRTGI